MENLRRGTEQLKICSQVQKSFPYLLYEEGQDKIRILNN